LASLGGQLFNLNGAPDRYPLGPFYELHVWAWKANPPAPSRTTTRRFRAIRPKASSAGWLAASGVDALIAVIPFRRRRPSQRAIATSRRGDAPVAKLLEKRNLNLIQMIVETN
jgi:hypothetical protein